MNEKEFDLEEFVESEVPQKKEETNLFTMDAPVNTLQGENTVPTPDDTQGEVENKEMQHEETSKEKFIRMFNSIECLSDETKKSILSYLEQTDFYVAPASSKFHYNCPEGLVKHSIHVAETLVDLTEKHGLVWERKDSPLVIGLLHDICKIATYSQTEKNVLVGKDPKTKKNIWEQRLVYTYDNKLPHLGVHGDKSVAFLLMLAKNADFTIQELSCIRYHMGNTQEGDAQAYSNVQRLEPLVVWTNVADTIASLTEPIMPM